MLFSLITTFVFAEIKVIHFDWYSTRWEDQEVMVKNINAMVKSGWKIIDISKHERSLTFVLEKNTEKK